MGDSEIESRALSVIASTSRMHASQLIGEQSKGQRAHLWKDNYAIREAAEAEGWEPSFRTDTKPTNGF